ncbi:2-oxoisovalerate dehydrogenase subunit beta [Burkholderiales bacterium 8X]|nr:2-oxoisovalerate dehydrogenase subunit beta [Burkholderiales bacterium 8X]
MAMMRYRAALRQGLLEEMERDPRVVMLGQDIGRLGGSFAVSKGLLERFGAKRIIETPISESAIVGTAVGMAMMGMRPIAELMFADFLTLGMDHLVNSAAKAVFSSGGVDPLPMVVRTPYGAVGAGMHHDQSPEAWVANVPGLRIAMPATPADAKGMLAAAIRDPNPVLFMEHKALYSMNGEVPDGDLVVPLGKARIARDGRDATAVASGAMVALAESAAKALATEGIEVEVVDLRSLKPLDMDTILDSVRRTRRAVVLHEAPLLYGTGAEIAAQIGEALFGHLLAPVRRMGAAETPVPHQQSHRQWYMPQAAQLTALLRSLVQPA